MDFVALLMGLCFSVMWSSAFATGRIIVVDASPLAVLALRFAISGAIAVTIARLRGQSWHLSPAIRRSVLIFGFCQNGLYLGLNFVALQWVEGALASVIASAMPLIVAAIGFAKGERLSRLGVGGLVAGFAGVVGAAGVWARAKPLVSATIAAAEMKRRRVIWVFPVSR